MEQLSQLLEGLANSYPVILMGLSVLGTLVVTGTGYIALTPTQNDDAWLAKIESHGVVGAILRALKRFSILERKK